MKLILSFYKNNFGKICLNTSNTDDIPDFNSGLQKSINKINSIEYPNKAISVTIAMSTIVTYATMFFSKRRIILEQPPVIDTLETYKLIVYVDDDYVVSTINNLKELPEELQNTDTSDDFHDNLSNETVNQNTTNNMNMPKLESAEPSDNEDNDETKINIISNSTNIN